MKKEEKVVLVVGLGRFGQSLYKTLSEFHTQVIAVDTVLNASRQPPVS